MKHLKHLVFLPALFYFCLLMYWANRYLFTGVVVEEKRVMVAFGFFAIFLFIGIFIEINPFN